MTPRNVSRRDALKALVSTGAFAALFGAVGCSSNNTSANKSASKQQDLIQPYLDYLGKVLPAGENISLESSLYNGMDDVEIMGIAGSIEYESASSSDGYKTIMRCQWTSHDGFSEDEYQAFAESLDNYFGSEATIDRMTYKDGPTAWYYWFDTHASCIAFAAHGEFAYQANGRIDVVWDIDTKMPE